jgi:plastocyanin
MVRRIKDRGLLVGAVLVVLAMMVLAACGDGSNDGAGGGGLYGGGGATEPSPPPSAGPDATSDAQVSIAGFAFSPSSLEIDVGTTVTWTNEDGVTHTVTAADGPGTDAEATDLFDSGGLAGGDTFSFTFDEAGTYYYACRPHWSMEAMHAEVIVR